jgi:hypothetical protein
MVAADVAGFALADVDALAAGAPVFAVAGAACAADATSQPRSGVTPTKRARRSAARGAREARTRGVGMDEPFISAIVPRERRRIS